MLILVKTNLENALSEKLAEQRTQNDDETTKNVVHVISVNDFGRMC